MSHERAKACITLGLPSDLPLTPEQLKHAYRKAAIRWHRNRTGGDAVRYAEIQQAHLLLEGALVVVAPVQVPAPVSQVFPPSQPPVFPPSQPPVLPPSQPQPPSLHPPLATPTNQPECKNMPEQYSVQRHDGILKLCMKLSVPLRTLVEGGRMGFVHTDGKRYEMSLGAGSWGGWAELPGLGLRPGIDALVVIVQPTFPRAVSTDAQKLISQGLALCPADHSLMLHELMPELTR